MKIEVDVERGCFERPETLAIHMAGCGCSAWGAIAYSYYLHRRERGCLQIFIEHQDDWPIGEYGDRLIVRYFSREEAKQNWVYSPWLIGQIDKYDPDLEYVAVFQIGTREYMYRLLPDTNPPESFSAAPKDRNGFADYRRITVKQGLN